MRRLGHFITLKLEKFCMLRANKIIHKGLKNELEFLSYYGKIKNKPHYLFREFINPDLVQNYEPKHKLSKKDGEIHLVYVGGFTSVNLPYAESIWDFYTKITRQKMHLHIYSWFDKKSENKLKEINLKDPYFHYEGIINHDLLIKEISKYDYGINLHTWNRTKIKKNYFISTQFANKYFDYFSAKLPLICLNELVATVNFLDKYKIGFHIDYDEVKSLKKLLIKNKKNYPKMIKNIDKAIAQLQDFKNFIKFVEY